MSITSALRRPRRGTRPQGDARLDSPSLGLDISECLRVKGYCVINDAVGEDVIAEVLALIEAEALQFYQPAVLVQEGLLGMEGSNRIAKVDPLDIQEGGAAGEAVRALDAALMRLANAVGPYQGEIGFRCTTRSAPLLHEAAEPAIEETDLTDHEANEWCSQFTSRKIMIVVFLGPDRGSLDLTPYDDESNPTDLPTLPGVAVLVRTDQLAFRFTTRGSGAGYAASTFMLQGDILGMHRLKAEEHMVPAAKELHSWIENRLREIKENEGEEPDWDEVETVVPRNFIMAANRTWFTRQQTAVRGLSARQPTSWETETLFMALTTGVDVVTEVPLMRWDHSTIYDAAADSWKKEPPKTACRHASFCEGVELFDNKLFSLSIAETRGMDPSQRQVLECTYDALHRSGMKKNTLMNSSCGMYVGMSTSDWNVAERSMDVGIFGATGGAPSICAGRLSFCLGCKGASVAVDTEAASALSSVFWAAESVEKKGTGFVQELACAIGVHLVLAKSWWPSHSASGFLCAEGRCFAFDASAAGYVRNECTGCAVVRARPDNIVDGEVVKDELPLVGTISGGATMNSGKSASMSAPNGPSEQAVLAEACRKSGIMPYDVDVVECHGTGKYIADAVEVASAGKALRGGTMEEMLHICSVKTNLGHAIEASGLASLAKTLHSIRWGVVVANVHLRQLNPHLDLGDTPLLLGDEHLEHRSQAVFAGVSSHGFGGTNVHVHVYGGVDEELRPPPGPTPEGLRPRLTYWPAGGGDLGVASRPRRGFYIVGTWNSWQPEAMRDEGDGCHGFTVALGEKRWEQFQIVIDGSSDKILHPAFLQAPKGTEVLGPDAAVEVHEDCAWLLDGTGGAWDAPAVADGAVVEAGAGLQLAEYGASDRGQPGDRYRICLHVAGKWRTVTWSKVEAH